MGSDFISTVWNARNKNDDLEGKEEGEEKRKKKKHSTNGIFDYGH